MTISLNEARTAEHAALANAFDALFALYLSSERVAKAENERAALILADMAGSENAWDEVAAVVTDILRANALGTECTTLQGVTRIGKHMRELQEQNEKLEADVYLMQQRLSRVASHDACRDPLCPGHRSEEPPKVTPCDVQWDEVNP